jgi:hypothetical protein
MAPSLLAANKNWLAALIRKQCFTTVNGVLITFQIGESNLPENKNK